MKYFQKSVNFGFTLFGVDQWVKHPHPQGTNPVVLNLFQRNVIWSFQLKIFRTLMRIAPAVQKQRLKCIDS
ncbi:hypothetical protein [Mucilaginibacter sp.]